MPFVTDETLRTLELRVKAIEERFGGMTYDMRGIVQSELKDRMVVHQQSEMMYGVYTALCIDTVDIWKQNRVRFFCPAIHNPKRPIKEMPWAYPISNLGGFDDSGLNWVPPAGSTVCLLFEAGQRSSPFYVGTTWHRNRGPDGQHNWGFNIEEYYKIWEGRRRGYLVGPDDGSQVFPPWNTESYNGFDLTSIVDFASNPEAQRRITYPNIYGFKTPEKHMIKMVDGDHRCNHRWKRFEIMSSCGNWIMLKDDHLHYAGQWAHPQCGVRPGDTDCIEGANGGDTDFARIRGLGNLTQEQANAAAAADVRDASAKLSATKKERTECEGTESNSRIVGGHPEGSQPFAAHPKGSQVGSNPYFKHKSECRPYQGPGTPQNNRIDLPQTGIQFMSISGHTFVMDDSVEEPNGEADWQRSLRPFDWGCNNHYIGRTYWKSATGHLIEMSDYEEPTHVPNAMLRGENNYIRLLSAGGNKIELNDHTVSQPNCPGCPPNIAGKKRGIFLGSTSGHTIELHDETNEQCGPCRREAGYSPVPLSKKAFVRIRSGYGLEMMYHDDNEQIKTVKQYIQIFSPQKDNKKRGPHIERFQEVPSGPGMIFLRAGGNYIIMTYDNKFEIIGDEKENPSNKIEFITKLKLVYTKDLYVNVTEKMHVFLAKERILLMAGCDCKAEKYNEMCNAVCGPCVGPVLVYVGGCIRLSDRVFASSSMEAPGANIFMLEPLVKCPSEPSCADAAGKGDSSIPDTGHGGLRDGAKGDAASGDQQARGGR